MSPRWLPRLPSLTRFGAIAQVAAVLAAWGLLAAALWQRIVVLSHYFVRHPNELWHFFSSDTVGLALMYTDLFRDGFRWWGWNLSSAPEYPEMAWYFVLSAVSGGPLRGHVLSALFQLVLLAVALWVLYRSLGSAAAQAAAVLAPLVAAAIAILINIQRGLDLACFTTVLRHASTVIVEVFGLACFVRVATRPTRAAWIGLLLLTGLGAASDALFLPSFTLPVLGVLLLVLLLRQWPIRRVAWPALAMLAATIVGQLAFRYASSFVTVDPKLALVPDTIGDSIAILVRDVLTGRPRLAQACILLACWATSLLVLWRRLRVRQAPDSLTLAALFVLLMTVSHVAAIVLTGKPPEAAGYTRYLLPIYTFGFAGAALVAWYGLFRVAQRSALVTCWASIALVAIGLARSWYDLPPQGAVVIDYYSPLVQCFDKVGRQYGLRYGVADYALANLTTAVSRQGLRVYPVNWRGDPALMYANVEWFLGGVGARHHDAPHYTFAILGSLSPERGGLSFESVAGWGTPRAVADCSGYKLLIFDEAADERIRSQFRSDQWLKGHYARFGYALP